jgi:hypothetical protein
MKPNARTIVLLAAALIAVVGPIVVYLFIFGGSISTDHSRWAEFGSAIGGIYSPLVALLTLLVLLKQVQLQAHMNVHEADQAFVLWAKNDIEFYCTRMAEALQAQVLPGVTARQFLRNEFSPANLAALDSSNLRQLAANLHEMHRPVYDIWSAVYPILSGLEAGKSQAYVLAHGSAIQKLIAMLSFETCATLDNFHRVRCEGRLDVNYRFSSLLSEGGF